jgi:hypothetical protein
LIFTLDFTLDFTLYNLQTLCGVFLDSAFVRGAGQGGKLTLSRGEDQGSQNVSLGIPSEGATTCTGLWLYERGWKVATRRKGGLEM